MKKSIIIIVITAVIAGGLGFWGGGAYRQSSMQRNTAGFLNAAGVERSATRQFSGRGQNGGFVSGVVISRSNNSMTVKLQNGGSAIVFFSTSTPVMESRAGSADDLEKGANVVVSGSQNADGSVTAQSIQLRPAGFPPR